MQNKWQKALLLRSQAETKFLKTEAHIKLFKIKKNLVSNTVIKKKILCVSRYAKCFRQYKSFRKS